MSNERSIHAVRRHDRAQPDEWVQRFLREAPFGYLATVADGQPFIVSNAFAYAEDLHALYFHTSRTGRTAANVAAGGPAAFSTATMGRVLPAATALDFGVEYAGVVAFGRVEMVTDISEKERALQLILDKYAPHLRPGRDYRPISLSEMDRTAVERLTVSTWSGKSFGEPIDFPGAFPFPDPTTDWFSPGAGR